MSCHSLPLRVLMTMSFEYCPNHSTFFLRNKLLLCTQQPMGKGPSEPCANYAPIIPHSRLLSCPLLYWSDLPAFFVPYKELQASLRFPWLGFIKDSDHCPGYLSASFSNPSSLSMLACSSFMRQYIPRNSTVGRWGLCLQMPSAWSVSWNKQKLPGGWWNQSQVHECGVGPGLSSWLCHSLSMPV